MRRVVDAPPGRVFAVLGDAFGYAHWVCGTREVRAADPDWPRVGARMRHRFGWPRAVAGTSEVLACDRPRLLVLRADVSPWAVVLVRMSVRGSTARSVVEIREDMIGGRLRCFGPATALVQRWRNAVSLRNLARLARRAGPTTAVSDG